MIRKSSNASGDEKVNQTPPGPSIMAETKPVEQDEFEFYVQKAIFSSDPLPENLLFPDYKFYVCELEHQAYYDSRFARGKLLSYSLSTLQVLQKTRLDIENCLNTAQAEYDEAVNRKTTPVLKTLSTANANYWRERVILYLKQTKYLKIVYGNRIKSCKKALQKLDSIEKILNELVERPRNMFVQQHTLTRFLQIIKNEEDTKLQIRLKAIDNQLADIKLAMKYIPRLFTRPDNLSNLVLNILKSASNIRDPLTKYLPDSNESQMFSDFVNSKFSPIRYTDKEVVTIDAAIELTIEMMKSFASIKQPEHIAALADFSVRYWFRRTIICDTIYKRRNQKLQPYLYILKNKTLNELKPPKSFEKILHDQLHLKPLDFFTKHSLLHQSLDSVFGLCFESSPVEISLECYILNLRFAGFAAPILQKDIHDKITLEWVAFLWKIAFIISDVPYPDKIFDFVKKYANLARVPKILQEGAQIPTNVINELVKAA